MVISTPLGYSYKVLRYIILCNDCVCPWAFGGGESYAYGPQFKGDTVYSKV